MNLSRRSALLAGVLIGAFLVRILQIFFSRQSPFFEPLLLDPGYYHEWALRIVDGGWAKEGVFHGLPLYPYFLAFCYKVFGSSVIAVKVIQAFLGTLTVFLIYKITEKISSQTAAFLAALLAAVYGPLFFHELLIVPESLAIPLYAGCLYLALLLDESFTVKRAVFFAFLAGLAVLSKAGLISFMILFSLFVFFKAARTDFGQGARRAVIILGVFVLTLLPVTLHNFLLAKDFVPLTSHGGLNFYIGNNPEAEGVFMSPEGLGTNVKTQIEDSKAAAERAMGRSLKPSEVSRYWSTKAWEFIRSEPSKFFHLLFIKFILFFESREISDVEDYVFSSQFNNFLKIPWPNFSLLGPLTLWGLLVLFFRGQKGRLVIAFWVFSYILSVILFFVNARYRLPLISALIPIAAIGLLEMARVVRERRWAQGVLCVVVLALGVGLTRARADAIGTTWVREWVNAGDIYALKGDHERALRFYQKAIELEPEYSKASLAMALTLTKMKRHDEAKEFYLRAIEYDPANSQAYNNLGMWYDRKSDLDEARRYFLKAVELKPSSGQYHNNLGMVYGKMGQDEKAIQEFEEAIRLSPDNARAYTNLGLIFHRQGRKDEAKANWRKALEINPDLEELRRALKALQ